MSYKITKIAANQYKGAGYALAIIVDGRVMKIKYLKEIYGFKPYLYDEKGKLLSPSKVFYDPLYKTLPYEQFKRAANEWLLEQGELGFRESFLLQIGLCSNGRFLGHNPKNLWGCIKMDIMYARLDNKAKFLKGSNLTP